MTLYQQIKKLAEKAQKETAGTDRPLMTHYTEDLYRIDKDTLENDSQAGDKYVWVIKENGCGSFLVRCLGDQDVNAYNLEEAGEKSRFYLLECTGENEGSVKPLKNKEAAFEAFYKYKPRPNRQPRRDELYPALNELFGWTNKTGKIADMRLGSELSPEKGDVSVLRVSRYEIYNDRAEVEVVRSKVANEEDRNLKMRESYVVPMTNEIFEMTQKGPAHFVIESQDFGYGHIKEASKRTHTAAVNRIEKKEAVQDDGMAP